MIIALIIATATSTAAIPNKPVESRPEIIERKDPTGTRIRRDVTMPSDVMDARGMAEYLRRTGECVVRVQPSVARRTVDTSNDYAVDYGRLAIPRARINAALSIENCLAQSARDGGDTLQWSFSDGTLHSFLVDPLYRATFKTPPSRDWTRVKAVPMVDAGDSVLLPQRRGAAAFGECVVRSNFVVADRLIRAAPSSSEEASAFQEITPMIPPCLEQGSTASLKKAALRILITDAAWRLATGTDMVAVRDSLTPGVTK